MPFILVADDRPLNRHFLMTLLTYYGHFVGEAADGVEALHAARERKPDLIIADVVMPRMDGPALARALRADSELKDVPIIFYSASYREVEAQAIAKACGVEHVITKPSDPEVILQTIARALGVAAPAAPPPESPAEPREIIARLQLANIRMTGLIELMAHLSGERDPHERLAFAAAGQIRAEHESLRAIEAELRTYREDLAALVDAAPVPIIAFDRHCIVQVWNPAAERTFGWLAAEVVGKKNPAMPPELE